VASWNIRSDSNLEILLNAIKEGDEAIMDFNYTMTGRRDPTYLGVVFNFDVEVCSNIDITSVEANARNSDKNSFCFFSLYS
jgi:hypothetical protein